MVLLFSQKNKKMKKILILGAGLSTASLIKYLLDNSDKYNWKVQVADLEMKNIIDKTENHKNSEAIILDASDNQQLNNLIKKVDIVISMLPPSMHDDVAKLALEHNTNMITASYVSDKIKELNNSAEDNNIVILSEMGVDPGIDHMSVMEIIDKIKEEGGKIKLLKSSTGGLVAPKYDNNPWNYKISWNPRNVVMAGKGVAQFRRNGKYKFIPYHKLFDRVETTEIPNYGKFEIYPNRDSLKYIDKYSLADISTIFRGTIRRPGYSAAWNKLVQLGLTDESYIIPHSEKITFRDFIQMYLPYNPEKSLEDRICEYLSIDKNSNYFERMKALGLLDNEVIGIKDATPADILKKLILERWAFEKKEKDLIVMQHKIAYEDSDRNNKMIISNLVVEGINKNLSAMAITVGLPVAIATKLILTGKLKLKGVKIPVTKNIYEPILEELKEFNIKFDEITT